MKVAVVDAGSNSFILLIAQKKDDRVEYLVDLSTIVGMGSLLKGKNETTFTRALEVVKRYHKISDEFGVDKRVIVGTEIFRKLPKTYFEELSKGFDISKILSGDEEARLSYLSVKEDEKIPISFPLVVDVGGGSVEFSFEKEGKIFSRSLPIGAIVLTNKFVKSYPIGKQLENARSFVSQTLDFLPHLPLVSIGGTGTTVVSILKRRNFSPDVIHGSYVQVEELEELYRKLCSMRLEDMTKLVGMEKGREKIISSGILILIESAKATANKGMYVSVRGHRYSVAKRMLERAEDDSSLFE